MCVAVDGMHDGELAVVGALFMVNHFCLCVCAFLLSYKSVT